MDSLNTVVRNIDFGSIDGKEEAKQDNFDSLFYHRNNEYQDLLNNNKFIVSGRKGVGKTLLINYLCYCNKDNKNIDINILDISDFFHEKLKVFNYQNIAKEEMDSFWEYVFIVGFIRNGINRLGWLDKIINYDKFHSLNSELKDSKFILSEMTTEDSLDEGVEAKLGNKSLSILGKGSSSKKVIKKFNGSKYYQRLESARNVLLKSSIFERVCYTFQECNNRNYIIYDDIDELYDKVSDRKFFIDMMNSMIRSASKFNNQYDNTKNKFKIILVFREDIINELQLNSSNLNKVMGSSSISINWVDSAKDANNPLIKMVLHKIRNSIVSLGQNNISYEEVYSSYLSQESGEKNIVELLIDRTFGRPRDVIKFLQIYQDKFPEDNKFLIKNLKQCYKEYSKWFYDEMCNEIHILNEKKEIEITIKAIQEMKKKKFSFEELKRFIESTEEFQSQDYDVRNLKSYINKLYDLGFIGNSKNSKIEFSYRLNHSSRANFNMDFLVHFGMQPYLSL